MRTERAIRQKLERFPLLEHEWDYYHMDQRINDRGVLIDTELVTQAIKCDQIQAEFMLHKAYELTGLENPNSVIQLKSWLTERGISIETLGKKDVAAMISDLDKDTDKNSAKDGKDQEALEMLKLRLQMAKSSIKKYQAAERCACKDGRARGLFQFSGANRTARWAGRFIQLQNLFRNELSTLNEARELIKLGCFDMVALLYGNVPDVLSQLIRTMLIPKPGCKFIVADFSAIEARVLAWLAGEQWRLDAFKRGEDIYCASASAMFGVPVIKHGINGELRQKGKIAELACIAEGQLVLTDYGYVPIEKVKKFMSVWDGDGWVKHDGVVYKGVQNVITYDGLTATQDHLVYVDRDKEPIPFGDIAIPDYTVNTGQMPVYDILNAGSKHRFLVSGKLVHNCGYQGGTGALTAMGALDMGLKEDDLPKLIEDWRNANPNIVKFWYDLEKSAIATINDRQDRTVGKIEIQYYANTLWLVLPSGRKLAYINPKIAPNRFGRMSLVYEGLNAANKWDHTESYGGKLAENVTQATSRDLLAEAMWRMEQAGLDIVAHVHDEVVLEVPENTITVDDVCKIMNQNPAWAEGLPLSSAGYSGNYYFKD